MTRGRTQNGPSRARSGGESVAGWLARTHDDPKAVEREWAGNKYSVLPLGSRFDAVRIPVSVVHAAVGTDNRAAVGPLLDAALNGPVIQDAERWFYALVPTGGAATWSARTGSYLARGWLGVPRTDQAAPPGMWWAVEMRTPGQLCALAGVRRLVETGFRRLAEEPSCVTAPAKATYKTPECRCEEHAMCSGPKEIRLPSQPSHENPAVVVRCDCGCHRS